MKKTKLNDELPGHDLQMGIPSPCTPTTYGILHSFLKQQRVSLDLNERISFCYLAN